MTPHSWRRIQALTSPSPPLRSILSQRFFCLAHQGGLEQKRGRVAKKGTEVQPCPQQLQRGASPVSWGRGSLATGPSCCHCPPCSAPGGHKSWASPLSRMQLQGRRGAEGTPSLARCRGDRAWPLCAAPLMGLRLFRILVRWGAQARSATVPASRKPLSASRAL